ncbi:hypothetical protein Q5W_12760 [Hydrogenophaga sp. PBC]|uniref:DUF2523 domain-containing protein n=1 Tax=Hydrogenophaga sp. PBC TaxID=795665 RepID=UPI0002608C8F|nr:DUF2523 domain-containing protein [Hydrogenophaga sp. PBC]AOS79772.1 hypothetical protein Q5W_12760 [Hydrogenophaga sp. PBC]
MNLATFLLAICQPLIGRILLSLGFSVVTITGLNIVIDQLKDAVIDGVGTLPADILNVFLLAGGGTALGLIFGAIAVRLTLWQISKSTRVLGVNPG